MLYPIMQKVQSSNVESVGYDEKNQVIHVQFITGSLYGYENVPKEVYDNLLAAPSIGAFIHREMKGVYTCKPLPSFAAFEKAAKPLVEYLQKFYCPHDSVYVRYDGAELLSGEMFVNFDVPD